MKVEIKVPQQGLTVDYVTLLSWTVKKGDRVKKGDILASIESEKATLDVDAPAGGVITEIIANPEEELTIGQVMGYIETEA
jgi:pyruvate dehydrogenase E2 component (dihydrolipoamide acetyltransferase)